MREYLKKENRYRMGLQTDQEFNQNEIKASNNKFNVEHFNSRLNDVHAVAAEQKIRKFKSPLLSRGLSKIRRQNLNPTKG